MWGVNPTAAGVARKLHTYAAYAEELGAIGVIYQPMVFTAFGAPDPAAKALLEQAAYGGVATARLGTPAQILRRWKLNIAVAIWSRTARMAHACLRPLSDPERTT